jgi:flagellar biosynthesis chaperone FliJ
MEKLRGNELKAYRQEEGRAELRLFDEIAVRDYARAQRQEKDAGFPERIAG